MPTWLGRSPTNDGWQYMHEDARVESVPDATLPPGFVPPGFETSSYADATQTGAPATDPVLQPPQAPGLGVPQLEAPTIKAPQPTAPAAPAPGSSSSQSVSSSWRGATVGPDGVPAASDRLTRRAEADANRDMALFAPSIAAQRKATEGINTAQAGASDAQAQGFKDEAILLRDQNEARQRELAEIDLKANKWTGELQEAINSIPTMDANRVFHNQTNRQSAATAIAAFMGGFLQPVLGTNTPMDIINKAIDRDIEEQKNSQEMAQRKVWNLKDLAARDENAAMWQLNQSDVARLTTLNALKLDVSAKVQSYQSDVMRKQGEKLLADLDKSIVDTYYNIKTQTRGFMEAQRHNMRMESIQSQELAAKKAEAEARAAADRTNKRNATFLHKDTGVRAQGPNAVEGGWVAPNEKVREEAARKFEAANTQWQGMDKLKQLATQGHLAAPGSPERARATAEMVRQTIGMMSTVAGLGQKEDTARMEKMFGGNPDQFFRITDTDTIIKVLQDGQDAVERGTKAYAKGLQYTPEDKVDWSPPPAPPPEENPTGPSAGTGILRVQKAVDTNRPDELMGGLQDIAAELNTYEDLAATPDGRKQIESWYSTVNQLPENQRTVILDGQYVDIKDVITRALAKADDAEAAAVKSEADTAARNAGLGEGYRQFKANLR